jgi:hypothetical protein
MALKKIISLTGTRIFKTPFGSIDEGLGTVSIAATIRVSEILATATQISARVNFTDGTITFDKNYVVPTSLEGNDPNFIRQVYLHLKTLPEFSNSEDC